MMKKIIIVLQICFLAIINHSCNRDDNRVCLNPGSVEIRDIRSTSITIDWGKWRNADSYTIEHGLEGFQLGTGTRVTIGGEAESKYKIRGLQPATRYAYYIKSNCSVGEDPGFIGPNRFLTAD